MLFEKNQPQNILICSTCHSTGTVNFHNCPECGGLAMGVSIRGKFLFWGYPLTRYHLALSKARRIFNKVRLVTVLILGLNFWFWFGFSIYRSGSFFAIVNNLLKGNLVVLKTLLPSIHLFWLGTICLLYLWTLLARSKKHSVIVEKYNYNLAPVDQPKELVLNNWVEARKVSRSKRMNISMAYTEEARMVLSEAYRIADVNGYDSVTPTHLFYALLSFNRIANIFIRLGIPAHTIQSQLGLSLKKEKVKGLTMPLPADDLAQILFQAYEEAYLAHQEYVSVTELLLATVKESPSLQEILFALNIDKQKLQNVVEWVRIRERLYREYQSHRRSSAGHSKKGMDKAMTAVQTPFLNQFSEDMTLGALYGNAEPCIAREKELEEIFRVVEGGQSNVILVGDSGVGKKSIMEGLSEKMVADDVPARLKDKRLVRLSVSSLLAGTTPSGAVERLLSIVNEIGRARNIILFIHNIHDLIGVTTGAEGGLDVANSLAEKLSGGHFLTFATTDSDAYAKHIVSSPLGNVFTKVEIREMDENQAIQVLESKVGYVEYKNNVFFSYDAIAKSVSLAHRFLHDIYLPGSALEIMTEAATYTHNHKGPNSLVTGEEVGVVVAEKTHIPASTVSADESQKLLNLEEEMHKRVVGQTEAVNLVANALRRARAEIRSTSRPIANFLFLGPTGVGKTELAKTIAEVYFGGEQNMIRIDMSEYQDKSGIYRLIGTPGEKGSGILTEAVRHNPFALLLLDEVEKADKDILNIFLQVMDDGRLTDSTGRVVDFTNVILIATSNAGTTYVQEQLHAGLSSEAIKERMLHGELGQYFRPEFLNRFDGIVLFKSLDREAIMKVAGMMLKRVAKDLEAKGIELKIEEGALAFLADVGFDPDFGARPMRRAIQERIENNLAELVLSGKLGRRDMVVIGQGGEVRVEAK